MEVINTYEPWSEVAEQCVIGSLLIDPGMLADVCDLICADSFYHANHRRYFKAITEVAAKGPVDIAVVTDHLQEFSTLEPTDLAYMLEMSMNTPSFKNVMAYSKVIKGKSNERDVLIAFKNGRDALIDEDNQSSEDRINNAMAQVSALNFDEAKTETFNQSMSNVIAGIEDRLTQTGFITGLETGLKELDEATCGLQATDLIVLGARPSMGKTTLAMNIASKAALDGKEGVTLVFSMEMGQSQLQQRLLASEGGIRLHGIQRPKEMHDFEWDYLGAAAKKFTKANMVIDDSNPLKVIRSSAKRIVINPGKPLTPPF